VKGPARTRVSYLPSARSRRLVPKAVKGRFRRASEAQGDGRYRPFVPRGRLPGERGSHLGSRNSGISPRGRWTRVRVPRMPGCQYRPLAPASTGKLQRTYGAMMALASVTGGVNPSSESGWTAERYLSSSVPSFEPERGSASDLCRVVDTESGRKAPRDGAHPLKVQDLCVLLSPRPGRMRSWRTK